MKLPVLVSILCLGLGMNLASAGNHDPQAIIPLLKDAKMTLLEGIVYAENLSGPATSAKFEVGDQNQLILSIYTVPEGLGVEPERATLSEVGGVVTETPFKPEIEVFSDKEHLARASVHMTLFQLSKLTLKQVIESALRVKCGTPIDVRNPMVRNRRPVADVIIVDEDNRDFTVSVDLLSGKAKLQY